MRGNAHDADSQPPIVPKPAAVKPRGAWLRLPSGDALNMAHAARIVDAGNDPRPMMLIMWAVPDYHVDESGIGETTLAETILYAADALAVRGWLDAECAP